MDRDRGIPATEPAGDVALANHRHERFCQLYAGKYFGVASQAYRHAGYKPKTDKAAGNEGSRLLENVGIRARVKLLREKGMAELAIDRRRILELRLRIAYNKKEPSLVRLAALKDIEKALGLDAPIKLDVSGEVDIRQSVITFVHDMGLNG